MRCALQEEARRLQGILNRFSTSEEQDRALLEGTEAMDWRERTIVEFRVARKEALRRTIAGIRAAAEPPAIGGSSRPVLVHMAGGDAMREPVLTHLEGHATSEL